jgi:hypothetical protein
MLRVLALKIDVDSRLQDVTHDSLVLKVDVDSRLQDVTHDFKTNTVNIF